MTHAEKLNMNLRSYVLEHSIRQEETTSNIILSLLRILKDKTKTLGNKSSSLSFKNKVDLLHDLGDLDDIIHSHLIKFMEIRNQFSHNPDCSSFTKLGEANSELTKHLKTKFKNEEKNEEKSLLLSYNQLFKTCQTKLLLIEREYTDGLDLDFQKYVNHEIYKRMDNILAESVEDWKQFNPNIGLARMPTPIQDHIDHFIISFQKTMATHRVNIFDELTGQMEKAFQRKIPFTELVESTTEPKEEIESIATAKPVDKNKK